MAAAKSDPRFIELNEQLKQFKRELTEKFLFKLEEFVIEQHQKNNLPIAVVGCVNFNDDENRYEPSLHLVKITKEIEDDEEFQLLIEEEDYIEEQTRFGHRDLQTLLEPILPREQQDLLVGCFTKDKKLTVVKNKSFSQF